MPLAIQVNNQLKTPSQYVQPPSELIKEVHKAVQDYGLRREYTMGLIDSINQEYTVAPNYWRMLFKLILTSAQYTVWLAEGKDLATAQTMDNIEDLEVWGLNGARHICYPHCPS